MRRAAARGFSLLEVMVALGILAGALTWIVQATARAIASENHAKLMTTATFLARGRLVELEDELLEKGFTDDSFATETSGDFEEAGFKKFKWTSVIDKIELPGAAEVQSLMDKGLAGGAESGGGTLAGLSGQGDKPVGDGNSAGTVPAGGSAGLLGSQFGIIKDVLEQSIRRARVKITWTENKREHSIEIVEYLTDPRRVDLATGGLMGGMPGMPGVGGGAGGSNGPMIPGAGPMPFGGPGAAGSGGAGGSGSGSPFGQVPLR